MPYAAISRCAWAKVPQAERMGHMSRAMLERYSHIRMAAKRSAVEALSFKPRSANKTADGEGNSDGVPTKSPTVKPVGSIQ
jgi:hypothetical protein